MSSAAVRTAVRARLASLFADTSVPVLETLNATDAPAFSPWVSLDFGMPGTEEQVSLGAIGERTYREHGTVQVHVFVPVGTGDADAVTLADEIRALFRGTIFDGVHVDGVDPPLTGDGSDDGAWFRASVAFDYFADITA